jgi:hypothetical protein
MDLGTPPEPGGEIFSSQLKNEFHKRNIQLSLPYNNFRDQNCSLPKVLSIFLDDLPFILKA